MEKFEAYQLINGFVSDCTKWNNGEQTIMVKAFSKAEEALKNEINITFTDDEIDLLCHAVISSVVDTSKGLQDRLYRLLVTHRHEDAQ